MKRLFEELYQADALVAVVTMAFGQSQWCAAEVGSLMFRCRLDIGVPLSRPRGQEPV